MLRSAPNCFCGLSAAPAFSEEFGLLYECHYSHNNPWDQFIHSDDQESSDSDQSDSSSAEICGYHIHKDAWDYFCHRNYSPPRRDYYTELNICPFFNFTFCVFFDLQNSYSLSHPSPPKCYCGLPVTMRRNWSHNRKLMFTCPNYIINGARPKCTWMNWADKVRFQKTDAHTHSLGNQDTAKLLDPNRPLQNSRGTYDNSNEFSYSGGRGNSNRRRDSNYGSRDHNSQYQQRTFNYRSSSTLRRINGTESSHSHIEWYSERRNQPRQLTQLNNDDSGRNQQNHPIQWGNYSSDSLERRWSNNDSDGRGSQPRQQVRWSNDGSNNSEHRSQPRQTTRWSDDYSDSLEHRSQPRQPIRWSDDYSDSLEHRSQPRQPIRWGDDYSDTLEHKSQPRQPIRWGDDCSDTLERRSQPRQQTRWSNDGSDNSEHRSQPRQPIRWGDDYSDSLEHRSQPEQPARRGNDCSDSSERRSQPRQLTQWGNDGSENRSQLKQPTLWGNGSCHEDDSDQKNNSNKESTFDKSAKNCLEKEIIEVVRDTSDLSPRSGYSEESYNEENGFNRISLPRLSEAYYMEETYDEFSQTKPAYITNVAPNRNSSAEASHFMTENQELISRLENDQAEKRDLVMQVDKLKNEITQLSSKLRHCKSEYASEQSLRRSSQKRIIELQAQVVNVTNENETLLSSKAKEREVNMKCKVCFEGSITHVLVPCFHLSLCDECCKKVDKCVICREPKENILRIYY